MQIPESTELPIICDFIGRDRCRGLPPLALLLGLQDSRASPGVCLWVWQCAGLE